MKVYELEWTWRDPEIWTELYYLSQPIPVPPNTSIHSPIRPKNRSDSILFLYYSGSVYLSDLSGFKCSLKEIFMDLMTANSTKNLMILSSKQFRHWISWTSSENTGFSETFHLPYLTVFTVILRYKMWPEWYREWQENEGLTNYVNLKCSNGH